MVPSQKKINNNESEIRKEYANKLMCFPDGLAQLGQGITFVHWNGTYQAENEWQYRAGSPLCLSDHASPDYRPNVLLSETGEVG